MSSPNDLLTVTQVAGELHLSPRAVLHRITAGTIKAEKFGTGRTSAYAITRAEVDRVREQERARAEQRAQQLDQRRDAS